VTRDVYRPPPPRREPGVSRRALLGLGFLTRSRAGVDHEEATARIAAGWDRDGHDAWQRALEPAAEVLVELAGVGSGMHVLNAAAGDGNVAAAALARGAAADACDISTAMLARGEARVPGARWRYGDVQHLPYADGSFDAVLSSFGAVLAPRARRTARELVRVTRPGGVVGLTAWAPKGLPGRLDELLDWPEGVPPPSDWGRQDVLRARLDPLLEDLDVRTRTVRLEFESVSAFYDVLLRPYELDPDRMPDLDRLLASCNNQAGAVEIDARYVAVVGRRPA
jgi:SAM-dependent methyltransferase